jgi:GNAT superfamily N-acetyltransferase
LQQRDVDVDADTGVLRDNVEVRDAPITIRSIRTDEEAQAFERLNLAWISELFTLEAADRHALGDPFGSIVEPGGDVLIARSEDRIVGCAALIAGAEGVFELSKMAVDAAERERGIGRKLLAAAFERARELGATSLFLVSNRRLAPALDLYESVGFRHVPAHEIGPVHYERADVFMKLQV